MMICFSVLGELSQSLFSIFKFKILQLDAVDVPHMTLMPSCILHCTTKTDLWISRDAKKRDLIVVLLPRTDSGKRRS